MKIAASILAAVLGLSLPLSAAASSSHTSGGGGGSHSSGGTGNSHSGGGRSSGGSAHPQPVTRRPVQPLPPYRARMPIVNPPSVGTRPVPNPNNYGYDGYWGNGFWGPLAYGLGAASYVATSGSPGAKLLQAYDLTQTPCGPPNLVEIYGPDGSEICAFPNALVAPGQYDVDPDTLTLYSPSQ